MAPRIKTSERIVLNSLELFNQQGERSISTNHIAAHMEISPGNLYYHFPNKQAIIAVLFSEYESLVDSFLRPPQGRAATSLEALWNTKATAAVDAAHAKVGPDTIAKLLFTSGSTGTPRPQSSTAFEAKACQVIAPKPISV